MAFIGPQQGVQNFFQNFGFVTFLTFGPLNFMQNFRKKLRSGSWDYWVTGQKEAKFHVWSLATCKTEFLEILVGSKSMLNIKTLWGNVFGIFSKMLIFDPKMGHFFPQQGVQNCFQNFDFITFLTFRPLNFMQNFRKNWGAVPEITGLRMHARTFARMDGWTYGHQPFPKTLPALPGIQKT